MHRSTTQLDARWPCCRKLRLHLHLRLLVFLLSDDLFSCFVASVTSLTWSTFSTFHSLLLNDYFSEKKHHHLPSFNCRSALIFTLEGITTFNCTSTFTSSFISTWPPRVTSQSSSGTAHCRPAVLTKRPFVTSRRWLETQRTWPSSP